jgi:hypothetical protein
MSRQEQQPGAGIPVLVIEVKGDEIHIGIATVNAPEELAGLISDGAQGPVGVQTVRARRLYRLAQDLCLN